MSQLQQQLSALSHSSWSQQIQIIQNLPTSPQIVKLITNRNFSTDLAALFANQHPRTQLVTVLTQYLISLFSANCNQLVAFANVLITSDCLVRLLGSGNRVVASSANQLIKCIVSCTDFKEKYRQIKYVRVLEDQFLTSKSTYVREKISLYFIFISTSLYYSSKEQLRQFQGKVVKVGLEDACQKVRKNMRQILQNIEHFQKQNQLVETVARTTSVSKVSKLSKNKKGNETKREGGPKVIFSSVNAQIFQTSQEQSVAQSKVEMSSENVTNVEELTYDNFTFYLEQLHNGQSWAMIQIAYKAIEEMIFRQGLSLIDNDQLYCQCIAKLVPFLSQKRAKMSESSCEVLCLILEDIKQSNRSKVISFVEDHCTGIIQQAAKTESVTCKLLPNLIDLNPTLFLYRISQVSSKLKVSKQKLLLLDTVLKHISLISDNAKTKKTSAIVKLMCLHIRNSPNRERDIQLASLAIISQLKSKHQEEVLTALLCQDDKTLSKIIQLAESIDESLKDAVIGYIKALKADRRSRPSSLMREEVSLRGRIVGQLRLVKEGKAKNLAKIGELFLSNTDQLEQKQYTELLGILEYLPNEQFIMEYRIILQQMANSSNHTFATCLLTSIDSFTTSQMHEHHQMFLMEIMAIQITTLDPYQHDQLIERCCRGLAEIYRSNKESLKLRSKAIESLMVFQRRILEQILTENEMELVEAFRDKMQEESQYF